MASDDFHILKTRQRLINHLSTQKLPDASHAPNKTPAKSLAAKIEARFDCQLSDDLAQWIDDEVWQESGSGEYHSAVDPAELLQAAPEIVWPALMPCDCLPLIGNDQGDWLCVRVDSQNRASEIVQWYHGGGDWIPWGRTLSEAIVFDSVAHRIPGPKRRHAIPAESASAAKQSENTWIHWALQHLPDGVKAIQHESCDGSDLTNLLIDYSIAEIAVRCECVQLALDESLSTIMNPRLAKQFQIDWNTAVEWMFDVDRIPKSARDELRASHGYQSDAPQDWMTAAQHCRRVTEIAPELSWGWDVLGYASEKIDQPKEAIKSYLHGSTCSVFTDQSVRLRTHWSTEGSAKFSSARLANIDPKFSKHGDYLTSLSAGNAEQRRIAVKEHWMRKADDLAVDAPARLNALISAGWDLGAEPMTAYIGILEQIVAAAEATGQIARSRVAATHLACLRDRYGL